MRMNDSEAYNPSGYPEGGPEWCIHHEDYVDDHNSFNCPLTFVNPPEEDEEYVTIPIVTRADLIDTSEFTFEDTPIYFQIVKEHTWKYTDGPLTHLNELMKEAYAPAILAEFERTSWLIKQLPEPKPRKSWWRRFMDWLSR